METATGLLHRLTSYSPDREWDEALDDPRVVRDFESNDITRLPWYFKRYPGSPPRVPLSRDLPATSASAVAVLAGTAEVQARDLDLRELSRLLHLSAGVVRTAERPYGTVPFRAAGSAGGRFPLELYVAVPKGAALPAGVHWFDPPKHALVQVAPPPRDGTPTVVVTGVPWRTGWRYRERGYRHIFWDAGTMLSQLIAVAQSVGITPWLFTRFPDSTVRALVGCDGVHEFPVAVVALGERSPALEQSGITLEGRVDEAPIEFPLVTQALLAGEKEDLGSPWEPGPPVDVSGVLADPIEKVVLARGSQRRMDPERGVSKDLLLTCMRVAMRGITVPHWVVVHDVERLAPGIYRWPELSVPVREGSLREELYRVCMDQGLAGDAAFVVIGAIDVEQLDDRGYREAQLGAGLVEGRLHLLAYALGASASGMTFLDSEIPSLLGERLDGLLFTCVGVPQYASSSGGLPGEPTRVRTPAPRL